MKNLKRVLSMALATVMVLGMMVVGSGAANMETEYADAIAQVKVLGVMEGDENGNFNADKVVTRNEMAVVMANLAGLKLNGAHPFTDVPTWADKYVGALYTNGLTSGTSATTYSGSADITTTTAALMIMKTLGYFEYQGEFGDDWQLATVKKATELDMFNEIDAGINEGLTRGELAQMIVNALDQYVRIAKENGGMTVEGNGITVTEKATYTYSYVYNQDGGYKTLREKLFDGTVSSDIEFDAFGRPGTKYTYAEAGEDDVTATYIRTADKVLVNEDVDYTVAELIDDADLEYDNVVDFEETLQPGYVVELFVNEDDKDVLDDVVIYYYEAVEVEEIEECDEDQDEDAIADGAELKINDLYDFQYAGLNAAELEEGDYLAVAVVITDNAEMVKADEEIGENEYDVYYGYAKAEQITGEATSVKGTEFVKIDGTKYLLAAGQEKLTAGKDYDVYVDANGFVIYYAEVETSSVIDDVYVVDTTWVTETEDDYAETVKTTYAQLIDMNGETSVIVLENSSKNEGDWDNALVTISDKKYTEGDTTYKANNDKYDLALWTADDYAEDWAIDFINAGLEIAADDTRVSIDGTTYRVNSKTSYIMIGDTKKDIVVTTKVGGVDLDLAETKVIIVICEEGTTTVNTMIVVAAEEIEEDVPFSEDLIFISSKTKEEGDGYVMQTVYFADGSKKTLNIADDQTIARGFYEYKVNEDGYYEIDPYENAVVGDENGIWDEDDGVIVNAEITDENDLYEDLLTVNGVEDINVADAKWVDAHSKTDDGENYTKAVSSLSAAMKLLEKDTLGDIQISMIVSEDGAVVIILTDANVYVAPVAPEA